MSANAKNKRRPKNGKKKFIMSAEVHFSAQKQVKTKKKPSSLGPFFFDLKKHIFDFILAKFWLYFDLTAFA